MTSNQLCTLLLTLSLTQLVSCVSVSLPQSKAVRSDQVSYAAPSNPFIQSTEENLDAFWSNPSNGNSISYLSDCQKGSDPSLEAIVKGVTNGLQSPITTKSTTKSYNNREAMESTIQGKVDGVPTKLRLTVLKKNGCIYILTYVALFTTFTNDIDTFVKFEQGFTVP